MRAPATEVPPIEALEVARGSPPLVVSAAGVWLSILHAKTPLAIKTAAACATRLISDLTVVRSLFGNQVVLGRNNLPLAVTPLPSISKLVPTLECSAFLVPASEVQNPGNHV